LHGNLGGEERRREGKEMIADTKSPLILEQAVPYMVERWWLDGPSLTARTTQGSSTSWCKFFFIIIFDKYNLQQCP